MLARSKNIIDVVLMQQGLHNEPEELRRQVQKALDRTADVQGREYDASLLGYGLCSNGIVGLSAKIAVVVNMTNRTVAELAAIRIIVEVFVSADGAVFHRESPGADAKKGLRLPWV